MDCEVCGKRVESEAELKKHARQECPTVCDQCGKAGNKGVAGLALHQRRWCAATVLGSSLGEDTAAVERAAEQQTAAIIREHSVSFRVTKPGPAPMPESARDPAGLLRDPGNRFFNATYAWYAYIPETVDITGLSVTGLPVDILHTAPSWQPHEVQGQIAQGKVLLTTVERYGGILRGSPYVHIRPPRRDVWDGVAAQWSALLPQEIAVEEDLLEQAETDLERAQTREERALARQRIRIFSTRVAQLKALDLELVYQFLVREHQQSLRIGRSDSQVMDDRIDERVEAAMDTLFAEHVG